MATEPKAPAPPPNLRASNPDDQGGECETCTYFDHGHCTAFPPLCVDDEWVCDHYKLDPKKPDRDEGSGPRTMKEANAETRRRFAAQRQEQ